MDCSTVADRVAAYLDGELARSEREIFEGHLESCAHCQQLVERVSAVDLSPPPRAPETSDGAFWSAMDQHLAAEMAAVQSEVAQAANRPPAAVAAPLPWWRRVSQWELRVSFPVVAGYAALLALALAWSWSNLERAQSAEFTNQNLAEQLEREQRQQAPQRTVTATESRKASTPYRIKF